MSRAFEIWRSLNEIGLWKIKLGRLEEMDEDLAKQVEKLFEEMLERGFSLFRGRLRYECSCLHEAELRAFEELADTLRNVLCAKKEGFVKSMAEIIDEKMNQKGVRVLERELEFFLESFLEKHKKTIDELLKSCSSFKNFKNIASTLLWSVDEWWILYAPREAYIDVFLSIISSLEEAKIGWWSEIISRREYYYSKNELPILVYVPSSLSPDHVAEIGGLVKKAVSELGIEKNAYSQTDLLKDVQNLRHYMYICCS